MKSLNTGNIMKMRARIAEALDQSCNVILDLTINEHVSLEYINDAIDMLNDHRLKKLMILTNGKMVILEK